MENFMEKNKKFVSVFQVEVMLLSDILHWNKNQTWKKKKKKEKQERSEDVGFVSQI